MNKNHYSAKVAREPVEPHLSMLLLVSVGQGGPVHDGEVNQPHVCVAQFLEKGLPKDQKVAGIFDSRFGISKFGIPISNRIHVMRIRKTRIAYTLCESVFA